MPVFKITQRRLKRKERDEELGLDEIKAKMREMGEYDNETDSDESDSESESEGGDGDEIESGEEDGSDDGEEDEDGDGDEEEGSEEEEEEDDEDEDEDDLPPMTPEQALDTPLYSSISPSTSKPIHLCALCPGKILKSETDKQGHLASKSHTRAHKRYAEHLAKGDPGSDDPREIAAALLEAMEAEKEGAAEAAANVVRRNRRSRGPRTSTATAEATDSPEAAGKGAKGAKGGKEGSAGKGTSSGPTPTAGSSKSPKPTPKGKQTYKQRKLLKAEQLVAAQKALSNSNSTPSAATPTPTATATGTSSNPSAPKLNRAARRLLKKQTQPNAGAATKSQHEAGSGVDSVTSIPSDRTGTEKGAKKQKVSKPKKTDTAAAAASSVAKEKNGNGAVDVILNGGENGNGDANGATKVNKRAKKDNSRPRKSA